MFEPEMSRLAQSDRSVARSVRMMSFSRNATAEVTEVVAVCRNGIQAAWELLERLAASDHKPD
jgi:hypothetical protein